MGDSRTADSHRRTEPSDRAWATRAYLASVATAAASLARPFVIVTPGRTGSEMLVSLLGSHPQITCDGEILSIPRHNPARLLEGRRAIVATRRRRAYGIKLVSTQLSEVQRMPDPAAFLTELHRRGWSLIRLQRRNLLEQAISWARALEQQRYHYRRLDGMTFEAVTVDPLHIISLMWLLEARDQIDDAIFDQLAHLPLVYEDDLLTGEAQQATVAKICGLLQVEPRATRTDLVKYNPTVQRELVSNYDEIASALATTRYSVYLAPGSDEPR